MQQEQVIREFSVNNGLILTKIFTDSARPGSNIIGRDGFQEMIHYFRSEPRQEKGIIIWNFQRFSRSIDDSMFFKADLRRRGYILHSLNDAIPEGNLGRLFEAVIDWRNAQFLEDLSRDVKRGLSYLVTTHGCIPGTPPRGFTRQPVSIGKRRDGQDHIGHRWAPDPELVPLVQQAFTMRASGASIAQIHQATSLYNSLNSYTTFFANRLYIGILDYGGQSIPYCDPVIDLDTWQAVQDRATHRPHPRRINSRYLLSGLAFCARCGSPLYGETSPQRSSRRYDRYGCTRAHRRKDCDLRPIPRQALEAAVLSTAADYILSAEVQEQNQAFLVDSQDRIQEELKQQVSSLHSQLRTNQKKIANLTRAIEDAGHSPAMLDRLAALENGSASISAQIASMERQLTAICTQAIPADLDELKTALLTADHASLQALLRGIIQKIIVDRQGSQILGQFIYFHPP